MPFSFFSPTVAESLCQIRTLKKQLQSKMEKALVDARKKQEQGTVRCKHCKRDMNPRSLAKHSKTCFGDTMRDYEHKTGFCLICGAEISRSNLKRHWDKVHVAKDIERLAFNGAYVCPFFNCGHTSVSSDELYAEHILPFHGQGVGHTDGLTNARRIQCIKCELSMPTQSDLW